MDGTVANIQNDKDAETAELERLFEMLPKVATLDNCTAFLKSKGLHFTAASWDDMIDRRFKEPLADARLTYQDVFNLVHEFEENSSKRVLLYKRRENGAHPIFDDATRSEILKKLASPPMFGERKVGELRTVPAITEIRLDHAQAQRCVVIKISATRTEETLLSERTNEQGDEVRTYSKQKYAIVNVVRLFEDGLLEMKIHREKESQSYSGTANAMWTAIAPIIDKTEFETRGVHQLLTYLWDPDRRERISSLLAVAMSTHRNGEQTVLEIRSGKADNDLNSNASALASVDSFHQQHGSDATGCRSAYLWVRAPKANQDEERELRIYMHGEPNEFSVLSKCRRVDYERALGVILSETSK